jgi:hypothetical protein
MRIRIKVIRPWGGYRHCAWWELPWLVFIRHIILFGSERDKLSLVVERKRWQGSARSPSNRPPRP